MDSLEEAVIRMATAQEQTTKNVDELRKEFRGVVKTLAELGVLQNKIDSAHRRIDEVREDITRLSKKIEDRNKLTITTMISAIGAMIGMIFMLLKG